MHKAPLTRRNLLRTSALAGAAVAVGGAVEAENVSGDAFVYEIRRSEAEWRAMLSDDEYAILREGDTEWPTTSPLWNDYSAGDFDCRGCDLHLYSSDNRAPIEKGWVFFYHSQPNAVLTDIDTGNPYTMAQDARGSLIEVHCRRCASHLGHILIVDGELVHCINGTSLTFRPQTA